MVLPAAQNEHLRNKGHSYVVLAQGQLRYRCRRFLELHLCDGKKASQEPQPLGALEGSEKEALSMGSNVNLSN